MPQWRGASSRHTRPYLTGGRTGQVVSTTFWPDPAPPGNATGTGIAVLSNLTSVASGSFQVSGTGTPTLDALTGTAGGTVTYAGPGAATLAALTSGGAGTVTLIGTGTATLASLTSGGAGVVAYAGPGAATLGTLTSTAQGARGARGTGVYTGTAIGAEMTSQGQGYIPPVGTGSTVLDNVYQLFRASAHGPYDGLGTLTHIFEVGGNLAHTFEWGGDGAEIGVIVERPDATAGTTGALRFPVIGHNQSSYFDFWAWATPDNDTLTVRYETDSEGACDFFRVSYQTWNFDGTWNWGFVEQGSGQGNGWQEYTTTLEPGDTRIRLEYLKDNSVNTGQDTAWISKLVYPFGDLVLTGTGSATLGLLASSASGRVRPRRVRRISLFGSTRIRRTA